MANAVTNKKPVLKQLVAANVKQSNNISKQAATIHTLSGEVKQLQLKLATRGGIGGKGGKNGDVRKYIKDSY